MRLKIIRRDGGVFNVIRKWIVGNLVVVPAQRSHKPKLVRSVWIKDERTETAVAVFGVMHDLRHGGFYSEIAAVAIHAGVIREPFGVTANVEFVIALIKIAEAGNELGLVIALESRAGNNVEDAVSAVAELSPVAATINFHVIDVLGIELRTKIGSDVRVRNGNAVDQPAGLVPAADVELVVGDVSAGHVVGNHSQTVGAISPGRTLDLGAVDESCGSRRIGRSDLRCTRHIDRLTFCRHF